MAAVELVTTERLRRATRCELGVELDADDFEEGRLGGDEEGAAFAGADVEKGVAIDGEGRGGAVEPEVNEGAEDGGRDAVVGGDVLVAELSGEELRAGDEAAGIGAVGGVEGVDGRRCGGCRLDELRLSGGHGFECRDWWLGLVACAAF